MCPGTGTPVCLKVQGQGGRTRQGLHAGLLGTQEKGPILDLHHQETPGSSLVF